MESNIFFKDINSKKEGNIYGTSPVPVPSDVINFGIGKISKAISNSDSNMVKFAYDENTDYTAIYVGNKLFTSKIVDSISELTGTNGTEENKGSKRNITFTKLNAATGEFTNDTFETIDSNWLENRINSLISTDEQYMTYMSDTSVRLKDVSANLHDTIYNLFEVSTYAYDTSININDVSTNLDKLRIYAENTSSNLKETNNTVNNIISNLYEVSTYTENVSTRFDDYKKSNDDYVKNISTKLDNISTNLNTLKLYAEDTSTRFNDYMISTDSSVKDISTRIDELSTNLNTLKSYSENTSTRFNDYMISTDSSVNDISTRLNNYIISNNSSVYEVSTRIDNVSTKLDNVSTNIYNVSLNLKDISTKVDDSSTRIYYADSSILNIKEYIKSSNITSPEIQDNVFTISSSNDETTGYMKYIGEVLVDGITVEKKDNKISSLKTISINTVTDESNVVTNYLVIKTGNNIDSSISISSIIGTGIVKDTSYNNETNKLTVEWVAGEPTVIDLTQLFDLNDIAISDNATDYLSFEPNSTLSKIGVKLGNINEGTKGIASTDTVKTYVDESISNNKLIVIGDEYISAVSSENNKVTLTASDSIKTSILNADSAINEVAVGTNANTYVTNTKNVSTATFDFTVTPKNHFNDISTNQTNNLITASALAEAFTWHFLN